MLDQFIPEIERARAEGATVVLKWDGQRKVNSFTVVFTRSGTDYSYRKDSNDLGKSIADALAHYRSAHDVVYRPEADIGIPMIEPGISIESLKRMNRRFLVVAFMAVIFFCTSAILSFAMIDNSMHIDDLYVGANSQKQKIHFLARVSSSTLSDCNLSVEAFERMAQQNNQPVVWTGDEGIVGSMGTIQIKKRDGCIATIAAPL